MSDQEQLLAWGRAFAADLTDHTIRGVILGLTNALEETQRQNSELAAAVELARRVIQACGDDTLGTPSAAYFDEVMRELADPTAILAAHDAALVKPIQDRIAELEAALEPFARAARHFERVEHAGGSATVYPDNLLIPSTDLTVGHLRAARKALGK